MCCWLGQERTCNFFFLINKKPLTGLIINACFFQIQGNLSDLGRLLMQGSFSVWTEHKKGHAKVKDLARFKPMQRHLFLHEKALLFCKRREENGEGYEKAPSYSFKHSLSVSLRRSCSGNVRASAWKIWGSLVGFSCHSSLRWVRWALQRMLRGTIRSSRSGATPEMKFL